MIKNTVTGLALVGFTIGVCMWWFLFPYETVLPEKRSEHKLMEYPLKDAYTLRAVGQEEFSDVKVPDTPADSKQQQ